MQQSSSPSVTPAAFGGSNSLNNNNKYSSVDIELHHDNTNDSDHDSKLSSLSINNNNINDAAAAAAARQFPAGANSHLPEKDGGHSHPNPLPNPLPNPPSRSGVRPTLRLLIATVSGFIVFVVAAVVLFVSNSVSTATARDLGISLSRALVATVRTKAQDYFERPVADQEAIVKMFKKPGMIFPADDPQMSPELFCDIMRTVLYSSNFLYPTIGIIFDDKSNFGAIVFNQLNVLGCGLTNLWNSSNGGTSVDTVSFYNFTDNTYIPSYLVPPNSLSTNKTVDSRSSTYFILRPFVQKNYPTPMWTPAIAWMSNIREVTLQIGIVTGLYNASNTFLGFLAMSIPSETLQQFFISLPKTPNSQVFAIDASLQVIAATAAAAPYTSWHQPATAPVPPGCLSTADVVPASAANPGIVCPRNALPTPGKNDTYPFLPLNYAAVNLKKLFSPKSEVLEEASIDGTNYFILSSPVPNRGISFSITIIFFMPEEDLLGDIIKGRNLSIIIASAILFAAVIVVFILIFLLLKPLNNILLKMSDATQLKLDEGESGAAGSSLRDASAIQEIYLLQQAFADMNVAVNSFVKYVPREVVRELIGSGELCQIGMRPAEITAIFTDIAGFTSLCERVPSDVLSKPLTTYFEKMTTVVEDHNLLISAFIGDAIFAIASDSIPVACCNKEIKAALCALEMSRATVVDEIWNEFQEVGEQITLRLGVNSGMAQCGNLGSRKRMVWTCLGDEINLSARLESFNKQAGTRVMYSESIASKVKDFLLLRSLMPIQVVGKEEPVMVYEAVGVRPGIVPEKFLEAKEVIGEAGGKANTGTNTENCSQQSWVNAADARSVNSLGGGSQVNDPDSPSHPQQAQGRSRRAIRVNQDKAFITALRCLKRSMGHKNASLVATDLEVRFVTEYSSAVDAFCAGDAVGCARTLSRLRVEYPMFFDTTAGYVVSQFIQDPDELQRYRKRCSASIITAEYSAKKLETLCEKCKNSTSMRDFVFRADEK